jgi:DNA gyrase subunit A
MPSDDELLKSAIVRRDIVAALDEALAHHLAVHEILFGADDIDAARAALIARFAWAESQAVAVLDMQQRRLPASERAKLVEQLRELELTIAELRQRSPR